LSRSDTALDLIVSLSLAGAAAAILVRPRHASRIAASPRVLRTPEHTRNVARQLMPASTRAQHWLGAHELAGLISKYAPSRVPRRKEINHSAGRRLNAGVAMLAFSVLADSTVEHYRGSFENRAMYTPLVMAALTLGASLFGFMNARAERHVGRDAIYAAAAATGLAGFCFHAYNILKRPGGMSWSNLFYAAPIGAPAALALAGLLGSAAERVGDTSARQRATVFGLPAGRMLAAVAAGGLAGTVGESGLLHFRGAYHDPAMMLPVTVPPVAAVLLGATAIRPNRITNRLARWWLRLTALLGFAGVGFHVYGVSRNMGGWLNWSQNVPNGPPLPAPPSFTGLALAGLAALSLIEENTHG
jgi:hypothetical protein